LVQERLLLPDARSMPTVLAKRRLFQFPCRDALLQLGRGILPLLATPISWGIPEDVAFHAAETGRGRRAINTGQHAARWINGL
jgi:hypothetical protein